MLVNKEPQFVGLTSDSGGHAIVACKIDLNRKLLYVADPNYPGEIKTIQYNAAKGKFDPYNTKQSANDSLDQGYWGIGYYAKTSMIDWNKISKRWSEFENKIPVKKIQYHLSPSGPMTPAIRHARGFNN
jgi:hypothetical protein